jgi:CsoR family transcriptional regulator, copper-sensing transcriptional repressor
VASRAWARMVEEDRYCIDVVTQVWTIRAALARVEDEIIKDHVAHCVDHAIMSGDKDEQRQKVSELVDALGRMGR